MSVRKLFLFFFLNVIRTTCTCRSLAILWASLLSAESCSVTYFTSISYCLVITASSLLATHVYLFVQISMANIFSWSMWVHHAIHEQKKTGHETNLYFMLHIFWLIHSSKFEVFLVCVFKYIEILSFSYIIVMRCLLFNFW